MLKGKNQLKAEVLHNLLSGVAKYVPNMGYDELNVLARTVGNSLFDMTPTWSGYKSKGLIEAEMKDPKVKKCPEHFYPRQVAGWKIIEHVMQNKGIARRKLFEYVKEYIQVHYTLPEENTRLVPYQRQGVFISPEVSYKLANVELVKVK